MWTPEEIRDAEDVALDSRHDAGPEFVMVEKDTWTRAVRLAGDVLKHRSDYSEDCEPLPVDEAFCREMGADDYNQPDSLTCLYWEDDRGWLLSKGVFGQWYVYGNELPEAAWPTTRPQLRSLLQSLGALGGGT